MGNITMITGGVKSGKSRFALNEALKFNRRFFIATAEPFDTEMAERIKKHKKERDNKFNLIEEPVYLSKALKEAEEKKAQVCLVDCLNVWLNNLFYYDKLNEIKNLFSTLEKTNLNTDIIFVTNEINMGTIPNNELARRFADTLGIINQKIAKLSNSVYLMISGIPIKVK